jgi:hypothetical protein
MMRSLLQSDFFTNEHWLAKYHEMESKVKTGEMLAYQAAEELFREFRSSTSTL